MQVQLRAASLDAMFLIAKVIVCCVVPLPPPPVSRTVQALSDSQSLPSVPLPPLPVVGTVAQPPPLACFTKPLPTRLYLANATLCCQFHNLSHKSNISW
eukprot:5570382-Amphidinium_carterae.1